MKLPKILQDDIYLQDHKDVILRRLENISSTEKKITEGKSLSNFANAHNYFGLHKKGKNWIYKDYLPNATEVYFIGDFSNWGLSDNFKLEKLENGEFQIKISDKILNYGDLYRLHVIWNGGSGDRIPAYAQRVVQDSDTYIFNAQIPSIENNYKFKYKSPKKKETALIYEAHIGMASEEGKVASYTEFKDQILPKIKKLGYDTVQLMAIQEHPYYGSFGYHVSSFFAASSRFGTPKELKELIDQAHKLGLRIIMDIVHSHAVKNEVEGISKYDGTEYLFFHEGEKGMHPAWDSRCFDYGKPEVLHFLLSNCKFWIEEYNFDGFRFDGITSMIYKNHGLGSDFTSYQQYFDDNQDEDALTYLALANKLIHEIKPEAISIAEEMSGMPGIATPLNEGGYDFDFRLAMGIPDFWIKQIKEVKDENWHVGEIFHRLSDKRADEKVISYAESHDQALVGDKTIMFRLADRSIYDFMEISNMNPETERAVALHKIIRLLTASAAENAYLNFMGNEFGHPEWIDFPREGNNWSYHYARRQWSLADNKKLAFHYLNLFDIDMVNFIKKNKIYEKGKALSITQNEYDQVLIFGRGKFVFIFNINPLMSFADYGFELPKGKYKIVLNSDSKKYLGYNRIDENIIYETQKIEGKKHQLKIYIPNRTCFVLKKM